MVPADSRRVPRVPRYLGATEKYDCIFIYGAITLYGRPSHAVLLTQPSLLFNHFLQPPVILELFRFTRSPPGGRLQEMIIVVLQPQILLANYLV